ncbi:MAG: lasso RiPP family leader peptide-containing protein [Candidatus Eisenbacteria bacterium]
MDSKRHPYEKPELVRHGNLKEITMVSFTPGPPPGSVSRPHEADRI